MRTELLITRGVSRGGAQGGTGPPSKYVFSYEVSVQRSLTMLMCSGPDPGLNHFRRLDPVLLFLMRRTTDLAMVLAAGQIARISQNALYKM